MGDLTPEDDIRFLLATNYFGFASYLVLVWDHIITFDDEVKYIWKGGRKRTLIIWLFLLNRYLIPLGFILNLFAYLSPVWTPERCAHFVRTEGAFTIIGIHVAALMMMIRVTAIYAGNRHILGLLVFLFLLMLSVYAWLMTKGVAVHHSSGARACSMIFDDSVPGIWASSSAWLPWIYDSVVFGLTIYKTIHLIRANKLQAAYEGKSLSLSKVLVRDGLLYYSMIFVANATLVLMIVYAPDGIKNICAQYELLITVTMMSRITLSLRKRVRSTQDDWINVTGHTNSVYLNQQQTRTVTQSMAAWTFGMGDKPKSQSKRNTKRDSIIDELFDDDIDEDEDAFDSAEYGRDERRTPTPPPKEFLDLKAKKPGSRVDLSSSSSLADTPERYRVPVQWPAPWQNADTFAPESYSA